MVRATVLKMLLAMALYGLANPASACEADVEAALARLQAEVTGELAAAEQVRVAAILRSLCREPTVTETPVGTRYSTAPITPARTEAEAEDEDTLRILGLEIKSGGPDSKGVERLRNKR